MELSGTLVCAATSSAPGRRRCCSTGRDSKDLKSILDLATLCPKSEFLVVEGNVYHIFEGVFPSLPGAEPEGLSIANLSFHTWCDGK